MNGMKSVLLSQIGNYRVAQGPTYRLAGTIFDVLDGEGNWLKTFRSQGEAEAYARELAEAGAARQINPL